MSFDSMKIDDLRGLLEISKDQLMMLQKKEANFGALYLPVYIITEIKELNQKISLLEDIIKKKEMNGEHLIESVQKHRNDLENLFRYSNYYHSLIESTIKQFGDNKWYKAFYKVSWDDDGWYKRWYISDDKFNSKTVNEFKSYGLAQGFINLNNTMEHFTSCFTLNPVIKDNRVQLLIVSGIGAFGLHTLGMVLPETSFSSITFALNHLFRYAESGRRIINSMSVDNLYQDGIYISRAGANFDF